MIVCINGQGHRTKRAAMAIYTKNLKKKTKTKEKNKKKKKTNKKKKVFFRIRRPIDFEPWHEASSKEGALQWLYKS